MRNFLMPTDFVVARVSGCAPSPGGEPPGWEKRAFRGGSPVEPGWQAISPVPPGFLCHGNSFCSPAVHRRARRRASPQNPLASGIFKNRGPIIKKGLLFVQNLGFAGSTGFSTHTWGSGFASTP